MDGDDHFKLGPIARDAACGHPAAMAHGNCLHYVEPESAPGHLAVAFSDRAEVFVEQMRAVLRGEASAVVAHHEMRSARLVADAHLDDRVRWSVLHGVAEEIGDSQREPAPVSSH